MTLAFKVLSSCSLRVAAFEDMPALFTSTSKRPCSLSTCLAAVAIDDSLVTSNCMLDTFPLMPAAWMAETAALPFPKERLAIMTWYFAEAEAMTLDAAYPIPELAPREKHVSDVEKVGVV